MIKEKQHRRCRLRSIQSATQNLSTAGTLLIVVEGGDRNNKQWLACRYAEPLLTFLLISSTVVHF